jgi:hypothetical protein
LKIPKNLKDGETVFKRKGRLLGLLYKDKRDIRLITTAYGNRKNDGRRPITIAEYNQWARGVDRANQNSSYYHIEHRSVKWWKSIFIAMIETTISNAYQLYRIRHPTEKADQLRFRKRLVDDILTASDYQPLDKAPSRIVLGMHSIEQGPKRNCVICSKRNQRKQTKYYCIDCKKTVHPECFYKLHTIPELPYKNK